MLVINSIYLSAAIEIWNLNLFNKCIDIIIDLCYYVNTLSETEQVKNKKTKNT